MYLTPERFRAMGLGADLSEIEEFELRSILNRASHMVDAYCNVPLLPQRYSFRGGSVTNEQHPWSRQSLRIYPWHKPLRTVSKMDIDATNLVYIRFGSQDLYVDQGGQYVEPIAFALQPHGFFIATGIAQLKQPVARIDYTYGYDFAIRGEYLESTDAFEYRAQNQFWHSTPEPVVYVNGSVETTGFQISLEEGSITFDEARAAEDVVTVDYNHSIPSPVAHATGVVATSLINDRDLIGKGLGNLAEISVEEVRLRRSFSRSGGSVVVADAVPDIAKALLASYQFVSVM
jgi:hypothetical protein